MAWLKNIFQREVSPEEAENRQARRELIDAIRAEKNPEHKKRLKLRLRLMYGPIDYEISPSSGSLLANMPDTPEERQRAMESLDLMLRAAEDHLNQPEPTD